MNHYCLDKTLHQALAFDTNSPTCKFKNSGESYYNNYYYTPKTRLHEPWSLGIIIIIGCRDFSVAPVEMKINDENSLILADISTRCSSPPQGEWSWRRGGPQFIATSRLASVCVIANWPALGMHAFCSIYNVVGWLRLLVCMVNVYHPLYQILDTPLEWN